MESPYQLIAWNQTNRTINSECINGYNLFGMAPIHVSLQAGVEDEMKELVKNGANPTLLSRNGEDPAWFLHVYGQNCKEKGFWNKETADKIARMREFMEQATVQWCEEHGLSLEPLPPPRGNFVRTSDLFIGGFRPKRERGIMPNP